MSETDGNHGSPQADARDAYALMQPYESVAAQSDNQTNHTDESLHYSQYHHPPQDAAGPIYQSEHPFTEVHAGNASDQAPGHELNGYAQSSESQPFYESNIHIANNNFANSSNEGYQANNNYGFDSSGASNIRTQQQFYKGNDNIKPSHDLNPYAQAYGGQSFSNTYNNSNNKVHQSNYGNGFNANDTSNITMQNHLKEAYMQNDTYAYANRQINSSPITEAIKDAFKTNSCQNSVGSWGSERRKKSNASDSDSDIEVWTKPSSNPTGMSSGYQASVQSNRYNSLGSTASSLTPNLLGVSNPLLGTNYNSAMMYQYRNHTPLSPPEGHVPTWDRILPSNYFTSEHYLGNYNGGYGFGGYNRKKIALSLINVWEFTLEGEVSRAQIKKIAKDHVGKDGRMGALFERVGIMPDDPALKGNNNNNTLGEDDDDVYRGGGKWRIPLGAYQSLMTYLSSLGNTIVEGIPSNQLQAATLGRERFEKGYPTADELVKRGVGKSIANALAPYQRGGVDFILDRNGRALLADEMGLGKTVQAIAAMSAYWKEWPLLVLTPSSARYHWEAEVRQWLKDVDMEERKEAPKVDSNWDGRKIQMIKPQAKKNGELEKEAVNVLTSGKAHIFRKDGKTKVVIVSYGLIVSLINNCKINPGMFQAIIVDESHALKNKASKRTIAVLPLLRAASRCVLLSGTPALARPSELWPQISVLGGTGKGGKESGLWIDEAGFYSKYVRGDMTDENASKARLAELHTLLTSTVMIRRMKADIMKNLLPKIREKAFIDIKDETLKSEFQMYMHMLKRGRGVMGKFAREHSNTTEAEGQMQQYHVTPDGEEVSSREALHHLYKITGKCKIAQVTFMLKRWLADPTLGKLCIFAHHLEVLDEIARGAGLNNCTGSMSKYIRIDGATLPKTRQEQILTFQADPTVRIALLGITAAGVAVTLTASSTVWFAELFWTPAIMIQAEDRCHRIGQQARVRCLYFIARGTLDEILWKLIEKKFRDLGEFVEGRENMDIALERELEADEQEIVSKQFEIGESKKRKAEDDISDLFDLEDVGVSIKEEINDLVHEEEDMLKKNEEEEDEPEEEEKQVNPPPTGSPAVATAPNQPLAAEKPVISLLDEEDQEEEDQEIEESLRTVSEMRSLYTRNGVLAGVKFDHKVRFNNISMYRMQFRGSRYGFNMLYLYGRAIVKEPLESGTKVGAIIVAVGSYVLARDTFSNIRARMRQEIITKPFVTLTFGEDDEFTAILKEEILPRFAAKGQVRTATQPTHQPLVVQQSTPKPPETVDLLDDD